MATQLFSSKQRAAVDALPDLVSPEDRERFFRFSELDQRFVRRFGDGAVDVALMLGSLRMLGFIPGSLEASAELVDFVVADLKASQQEEVGAGELAARSRRDRVIAVVDHAGWRRPSRSDLKVLGDWLLERAMEHDKPAVLFGLTLD